MARCVKLFPSRGGLPQRSLTTPWLVSSPGKAALPPLLRLSKLLRGIVSVTPPSSPNAKAASSSMIVSDGGGAPSAPTSPQANASPRSRKPRKASPIVSDGAASSRRPRKPKASSSPLPNSAASSPPWTTHEPPEIFEELREWALAAKQVTSRQCRRSHARLPEGKGQYIYADGDDDFCGYIPTPDEIFPSDLHPALREDEAKYVWSRFIKDPDSIAKPGDKFSMSPMQCKHNVVEVVHEHVVTRALLHYYYKHNGGRKGRCRRGRRPWSEYAESLIGEY